MFSDNMGWNYPPVIGSFAVVSPRTCDDCSIEQTLWWELNVNNTPIENLSKQHNLTCLAYLMNQKVLNHNENLVCASKIKDTVIDGILCFFGVY
jgi:hypothetical protein